MARLTDLQRQDVRKRLAAGEDMKALALEYGIKRCSLYTYKRSAQKAVKASKMLFRSNAEHMAFHHKEKKEMANVG